MADANLAARGGVLNNLPLWPLFYGCNIRKFEEVLRLRN
jgi:hypothetical protein